MFNSQKRKENFPFSKSKKERKQKNEKQKKKLTAEKNEQKDKKDGTTREKHETTREEGTCLLERVESCEDDHGEREGRKAKKKNNKRKIEIKKIECAGFMLFIFS